MQGGFMFWVVNPSAIIQWVAIHSKMNSSYVKGATHICVIFILGSVPLALLWGKSIVAVGPNCKVCLHFFPIGFGILVNKMHQFSLYKIIIFVELACIKYATTNA
jgi:hypothetical protein